MHVFMSVCMYVYVCIIGCKKTVNCKVFVYVVCLLMTRALSVTV